MVDNICNGSRSISDEGGGFAPGGREVDLQRPEVDYPRKLKVDYPQLS